MISTSFIFSFYLFVYDMTKRCDDEDDSVGKNPSIYVFSILQQKKHFFLYINVMTTLRQS